MQTAAVPNLWRRFEGICKLDFSSSVSIEGQGNFLTLAEVLNIQKFKQDFLRNYFADLNQSFYESFQVQGNENLMT